MPQKFAQIQHELKEGALTFNGQSIHGPTDVYVYAEFKQANGVSYYREYSPHDIAELCPLFVGIPALIRDALKVEPRETTIDYGTALFGFAISAGDATFPFNLELPRQPTDPAIASKHEIRELKQTVAVLTSFLVARIGAPDPDEVEILLRLLPRVGMTFANVPLMANDFMDLLPPEHWDESLMERMMGCGLSIDRLTYNKNVHEIFRLISYIGTDADAYPAALWMAKKLAAAGILCAIVNDEGAGIIAALEDAQSKADPSTKPQFDKFRAELSRLMDKQ